MADNAFGRGRQLLLEGTADSANENFKGTSESAKELTREMSDAILAIKSLVNESKSFSATKNHIDEITKAISNLINTARSADIGEAFTASMSEMGKEVVSLQQQITEFSRNVNSAFKADGTLKEKFKIDEAIEDFGKLTNKVKEFEALMGNFKQASADAGLEIPQDVLNSYVKAQEELAKLRNEMKAIADVNPLDAISKNSDGFKNLREQVSETAEVLKTKGKDIREHTINALTGGAQADNGTIAILNQMSQAMDELGKISGSNQKLVGNMYSELQKMGGIDTGNVTQGLETYTHAMKELEKAKSDLNKVLSDNHLSKDAEQVHAALTKVMTIQEELVKTGKKVSDEYKSGGVGRLGIENYQEFNDEIGKIIKNYDELTRAAKSAGIEIDNAIDDDDYADFAQGGRNRSASRRGGRKGFGGAVAAIGNAGEAALDFAETGFSRTLGLGQNFARIAGLGSLTSLSGLGSMLFSKNNEYSDLWMRSAMAGQGAGASDAANSAIFQDTFNRGTDAHRRTNGVINWRDYEEQRINLNRSVMGQYGSNDAAKDGREMGELAETSTIYQKALGVSDGTMNTAINTFYKEYKMNLSETEHLLSKVANQSMALNIPMEQHLKNVMQLSESYREFGLGVTDAENAITNLMSTDGDWGMNQKDAMRTAGSVGSGMQNLSDGWAAYGGMKFGGAGNPFEAIWNYKDKWNADGSVKEDWADNTANMITGIAEQFKGMAGGNEDAQKYLQYGFYKNQMGMDEKTATQLANTNDPEVIKKILKDMDMKGENKGADETQSQLLGQIEKSSEHLSGVQKTLAALDNSMVMLAAQMKEPLDWSTDFSKGIYGLSGMIGDGIGTITDAMDKYDELQDAMNTLTVAIGIATAALVTMSAIGGISKGVKAVAKGGKKLKNKVSGKRKERNNRPGKNGDADDKDGKNKSNSNDPDKPNKGGDPNQPKLPPPDETIKQTRAQRQAAEKAAAKAAKKAGGKTAGKIGGRILTGGAISAALIDPAINFGSALFDDGKIDKKEAKDAAKTTGATWATVGTGAAIGAGIGSIVPGVGTLIGASAGATVGGIVDIFTNDKVKKGMEKAGEEVKEGSSKAGAAIGAGAAAVGGFFAKSAKSVSGFFRDSGKSSSSSMEKMGKDVDDGSKKAKKDLDKAGKSSKKDLEDVGNDVEKGSKKAKKDLDKAGKGTSSDIESVGKNAGKGYDKTKKHIEKEKKSFDDFLDKMFKETKEKKGLNVVAKTGGILGGIAGIGAGIMSLFGGDKDTEKAFTKEKREAENRSKEIRDINKNHLETSKDNLKESKKIDKTGGDHYKEAKDQSKTLDDSLSESKGFNAKLKDYVSEKFPDFHKDSKNFFEKFLDKLGISNDELIKLSGVLASSLPELLSAIQNISIGTGSADAGGVGLADSIAEMIGMNEGDYGSVVASDNGHGLSIGKLQWHENRARDLLKSVKEKDPSTYNQITGKLGLRSLDKSWDEYKLSSWQASELSKLLETTAGKEAQDELIKKDVNGYVSHAKGLGITDPQAIAYLADIENQGGYGAAKRIAGAAKGKSLDALHKAAMNDSVMGKYSSRRKKTYEAAKKFSYDAGGVGLIDENVADWYFDNYNITSRFGAKESFRAKAHNGLDFDGKMGDLIAAIAGGTVTKVETGHKKGEKNSYGNLVEVKQADGTTALYSHLKDVNVKVGQKVGAGAKLGTMGNTGSVFSTTGDGSHLHLGLKDKNGNFINPETWMKKLAGNGGKTSSGDAGGVGLADSAYVGYGSFITGNTNNDQTRPYFTSVGSKSIYGGGSDASWSARGLYKGSLAYSMDGVNHVKASRDMGKDSQFQINIYADPGRESDYYKELSKYVEKKVAEAEKRFAEEWKKTRQYQS